MTQGNHPHVCWCPEPLAAAGSCTVCSCALSPHSPGQELPCRQPGLALTEPPSAPGFCLGQANVFICPKDMKFAFSLQNLKPFHCKPEARGTAVVTPCAPSAPQVPVAPGSAPMGCRCCFPEPGQLHASLPRSQPQPPPRLLPESKLNKSCMQPDL